MYCVVGCAGRVIWTPFGRTGTAMWLVDASKKMDGIVCAVG